MFELEVERGMKLLTHEQIHSVNLETLEMRDCYQCVLGQVFGEYEQGVKALLGAYPRFIAGQPASHGFIIPEIDRKIAEMHEVNIDILGDILYDELTKTWRKTIEHYRASRPLSSPQSGSASTYSSGPDSAPQQSDPSLPGV